MATRLGVPCVYLAVMLIVLSSLVYDWLEREKLPGWTEWGWFVLTMVHWILAMKVVRYRSDEIFERVHDIEIEHMDLEDKGEAIEQGYPGWRLMRGTVAIHEGQGRLHRTRIEWVEMLAHPETRKSIMLRSSDPALNARMANNDD